MDYIFERQNSANVFDEFACGVPEMDNFIHEGLELSISNHYCNAYAVRHDEAGTPTTYRSE